MPSEDRPFSELQLGIRELFRILFPGAYAMLLLVGLAPNAALVQGFTSSSVRLTAAVLLLGVVGYALRTHECWWPYSWVFETHRKQLNDEIQRVSKSLEPDLKAEYKYFLTTGRRDVADRVHYFSSFYYMLATLSLYSLFAAGTEVLMPAFNKALDLGLHALRWFSGGLLVVAVLWQLFLMHATGVSARFRGVLEKYRRRLDVAPVALTSIASLILVFPVMFSFGVIPSAALTARVCVLLIVSFAFANLGNKQWQSIIKEQMVHVGRNGSAFASPADNFE